MRLLGPASENDMIAVFLAAEASSERYGPQIREILSSLGQPFAIAQHPDTSDEGANAMRRHVLAAYRGYPDGDVFTGMPADVTWHHAALTPSELATVRYLDYPYWTDFWAAPGWPPTAPAGSAPGRTSRREPSTGRSPRTSGTGGCPLPSS
jgi:hypothetical protein